MKICLSKNEHVSEHDGLLLLVQFEHHSFQSLGGRTLYESTVQILLVYDLTPTNNHDFQTIS